jgi:hypothetical protein
MVQRPKRPTAVTSDIGAMNRTHRLAALTAAAATVFVAAGCGSGQGLFGEIHSVKAEVTGTGHASEVTYRLFGYEGTDRNVALPWKKDGGRSEFTPVSVTVTPADGATVSCRLFVDGKQVAAATGTPGAPATCSKEKVK